MTPSLTCAWISASPQIQLRFSSALIPQLSVADAHQAKVEPMLHVTIALHKGLNGPLTGTGAMEAPGAGASMTLEVDFQTPGHEDTHHMSMPIGTIHCASLSWQCMVLVFLLCCTFPT